MPSTKRKPVVWRQKEAYTPPKFCPSKMIHTLSHSKEMPTVTFMTWPPCQKSALKINISVVLAEDLEIKNSQVLLLIANLHFVTYKLLWICQLERKDGSLSQSQIKCLFWCPAEPSGLQEDPLHVFTPYHFLTGSNQRRTEKDTCKTPHGAPCLSGSQLCGFFLFFILCSVNVKIKLWDPQRIPQLSF